VYWMQQLSWPEDLWCAEYSTTILWQPTVQILQLSTRSCSYEYGNISNLSGCFWKYSGYGDRAQTVLDRENKVRERSQVLPGKSCLRRRSVLKHKKSLNKMCIIWFG
jgi:hypothetical protein